MPPSADSKLLFTVKIQKMSKLNISRQMLLKNWSEVGNNVETDGCSISVKGRGGANFDLFVQCHHGMSGGRPTHRFFLQKAQPLIENLDACTGDILGIALSPDGIYTGEFNTDRVLVMWDSVPHDFPMGTTKPGLNVSKTSSSHSDHATRTKQPGDARKASTGGDLKDRNKPTATDRRLKKRQRPNSAEGANASAGMRNSDRIRPPPGTYQDQYTYNQAEEYSDDFHTIVDGQEEADIPDQGARRQPLSMPLLPGEIPLKVERIFGEGRPLVDGPGSSPEQGASVPLHGSPCDKFPPMQRFHYAARDHARVQLAWRAANLAGGDHTAYQHAIDTSDKFERLCLMGEGKDAEVCKQVCRDYVALMRRVYGETLVLEPHVLKASVLEEQEGSEALHLFRCMERRFIIWTDDRKQPADKRSKRSQAASESASTVLDMLNEAAADQQQPSSPGTQVKSFGWFVKSWMGSKDGPGPAAAAGSGSVKPLSRWDAGLKAIWGTFVKRLKGKTYEDVDLHNADFVSCALNDTVWKDGHVIREALYSDCDVLSTLVESQTGKRPGRLYLTDGSMPDYDSQKYPRNAPGMPCGIDCAVNAMMPHAVASNRGTNLFHALKNESTGTRTFTLFAPVGGGTNLTAFHFETKRRRSYNCGSGDLIIQPLATLENIRKLMRVHAAVAGCHSRHGQLLPLECYLEEGIAMVVYMRDGDEPTLCELPEQSMHAFISFSDIGSPLPALKVSCNDFDLVWEVDSAYWLEKLARAYDTLEHKRTKSNTGSRNGSTDNQGNTTASVKVLPGEGFGEDAADTWVQSCYLTRHPGTMTEAAQRAAPAPWMCELQDDQGLYAAAEAQHCDDIDLHWGMDVIVVRMVEKFLAVAEGKLTKDTVAPWAGELPSDIEIYQALKKVKRVVGNMVLRSNKEGFAHIAKPDLCEFTEEYLIDLVKKIRVQLDRYKDTLDLPEVTHGLIGEELDQSAYDGSSETWRVLYAMLVGKQDTSEADAVVEGGLDNMNKLAPAMLRYLWLVMIESEWRAAVAPVVDYALLAKRRRYRSDVELAWDLRCKSMAKALGAK